ncbi:hypothetical protein [Christiangramia echinicola]|uniref:hypothetical protein n=1 Tax=Christiangramia echinicola TaxID=279359 RepID=UPI0003F77A0F|nr:hypothetical protein [Christiangramia echinicola]
METKKNLKGVKLGIGIILGSIVGYLTSNIQLWFVLGIAIGAALEYGTKKKIIKWNSLLEQKILVI